MKTNVHILLAVLLLTACTTNEPAITSENWGTVDSKPVYLYTLTNANGLTAKITNYGCIIVAFNTPDRNGKLGNIVLGLGSLNEYLAGHPYFGSIVGRYADLIENAKFTLDGTEYHLSGDGHGGAKGFDKKVWDATTSCDNQSATLSLTCLSADKDQGYPGNLSVKVDYVLNNDNELQIHYTATTDKPTVLNLTNHSYFNLTDCEEDVRNHRVIIYADMYTPYSDERNIPTGEFAPVEGTPFDLLRWTTLGDRFTELPQGFDHCFCIKGAPGNPVLAAELSDPKSGRLLQTYSTQPGLQLYTACYLDGSIKGAQGASLTQFMGACFEAQHFANSPNTPTFPTTVLRPGETFRHTTIYKAGLCE